MTSLRRTCSRPSFPAFYASPRPKRRRVSALDEAVFLDKQAFTDWPEGDRREMDLLAEVPTQEDPGSRVLIHVEIEARARADMPGRFWRYHMQLRLRHGLPVVPILVNLKGGRPGVHWEHLKEGFEEAETSTFRFRAFSLSGCRAEDYLASPEPIAWALAASMRRGKRSRAEHKIECLRRIAGAKLSGSRRWLLGNWVETYLQLDEREAVEYERLRELAVNQEVKAMQMTWEERMEVKYAQKYTQKGIEKGIEALREVVLQLLGRRFGAVPDTVRRKVEAIDEMKPLADLASRVLDIESVDDVGLS